MKIRKILKRCTAAVLAAAIGVTTLAAIHDMNLASLFCDRIYVMRSGKIYACGTPDQIIKPGLIKDVFGVTADIHKHELTGKPHAAFIPKI